MDSKKLTREAVESIIKLDHKSYQHRYGVTEYDNLTMSECHADLENFDGGRTDKEGHENKAREGNNIFLSLLLGLLQVFRHVLPNLCPSPLSTHGLCIY